MSSIDPVEVFRTEAAELLEQIEQGLLDLENRLDDRSLIDAVFRGLHTLKGSGAMFGFEALASFTHYCETAFDRVRKGEAPATRELVAAILAARDHMRALIDDPRGDHSAIETALLSQLTAAVGEGAGTPTPQANAAAPVAAAPSSGAKTWRIRFSLPANTMVNGTNPLALLDELREMGDCKVVADRSGIPALSDLVATDLYVTWSVELTTERTRADIEDVFIFVMDEMTLEIEEAMESVAAADGAVSPATSTIASPVVIEPTPMAAGPVASRPAEAPAASDNRPRRTAESVRVPAERLDELMDRVGELVIAQSRLSQIAGASMDTSCARSAKKWIVCAASCASP